MDGDCDQASSTESWGLNFSWPVPHSAAVTTTRMPRRTGWNRTPLSGNDWKYHISTNELEMRSMHMLHYLLGIMAIAADGPESMMRTTL